MIIQLKHRMTDCDFFSFKVTIKAEQQKKNALQLHNEKER